MLGNRTMFGETTVYEFLLLVLFSFSNSMSNFVTEENVNFDYFFLYDEKFTKFRTFVNELPLFGTFIFKYMVYLYLKK